MGKSQTPRGKRTQGLSRIDPRWTVSALRPKGALAYDSDYTQQGALPGIPVPQQASSMTLQTSGSQEEDGKLDLLVRRAGHPVPDGGGFVVRDVSAGDSATEYLGQDGFQVVTGWGAIRHDITGVGGEHRVPVIRLLSGDLLAAHTNNGITHEVWRMDAGTGSWSLVASQTINPGTSSDLGDPALVQLPSGRVLYLYIDFVGTQVHVRYSDDDGTTWADYANAVLTGSSSFSIFGLSAAWARGAIVLFTVEGTRGSATQQWVSHDLGTTFQRVGVAWYSGSSPQEKVWYPSLVGLPSGQVVMAYWSEGIGGPGTESYIVRRIDPARPGYETSPTTLYSAPDAPAHAEASCAAWADEDGVIYSLWECEDGVDQRTMLQRSHDGGATWTEQKIPTTTLDLSATSRPHNFAVASTGGRAAWVMRWTGAGTTAHQSIAVAYLGGHSWATVGIVDDGADDFAGRSYLGWGAEQSGDARFGGCWLPTSGPVVLGWTAAGAGTSAIASPLTWRIVTAANTLYYTKVDPAPVPSIGAVNAGFQLRVVSGGSLATPDIAIRVRISDYDAGTPANATKINEVEIRFTATGFRVYDTIGLAQVGADVTWDMTETTWISVAMRADNGNGEVAIWYGSPFGPARRLNLAVASFALADDSGVNPTNASRVQWGHIAAGNAQSEWDVVGFAFSAGPFAPAQASNFVSSWDNPTDLRARDFSTTPALVLNGVRLRAIDGPAVLGETWEINTRYDYGVANIHPGLSPSPRVPWRSKDDKSLQRIVWDLEGSLFSDAYMLNDCMLFLLLGANFKTARIRCWDTGTASWVTVATLDASDGFSGLTWARKGSSVRPNNAAASVGERYLWRHQHAGDTFDLGAGEDERYNRIQTNSEGAWRSDGSGDPKVKQPTLLLERDNLDGAMASTGTGAIWCRDFGCVVREFTKHVQRWALEIPAQDTVEGYFQLGAFFAGDVLVFAQQYDLGWIWTREWNTELQTRQDGTRRSRLLGPPRRSIQFAWVETAVQAWAEQEDDPDPDWISSGFNDRPVASRGDVIRAMEGLLEQADGPREPLVYLSRIPSAPEGDAPLLLTDRRRWLYGRIGTSLKTEALAARTGEAVDEVERLNAVTIEEEV